MSNTNVVNPGLVNVADQADGLTLVNQAITVTPTRPSAGASSSGPGGGRYSPDVVDPGLVRVADQADGLILINQTITVT